MEPVIDSMTGAYSSASSASSANELELGATGDTFFTQHTPECSSTDDSPRAQPNQPGQGKDSMGKDKVQDDPIACGTQAVTVSSRVDGAPPPPDKSPPLEDSPNEGYVELVVPPLSSKRSSSRPSLSRQSSFIASVFSMNRSLGSTSIRSQPAFEYKKSQSDDRVNRRARRHTANFLVRTVEDMSATRRGASTIGYKAVPESPDTPLQLPRHDSYFSTPPIRLLSNGAECPQTQSQEAMMLEWQAQRLPKNVPIVSWAELSTLKELGQGEFCVVHSTHLYDSPIALKVLRGDRLMSPAARRDFELEIQLMSRLDHPNILKVRAVGQHPDGLPFLCLDELATVLSKELPKPFAEASLWARQKSIKRWPMQRAVRCGMELASALNYLHHQAFDNFHILHRDLKPSNIGFLEDGRLVLLDFGLAAAWKIDGDNDLQRRPLTGETGSLRYMSPEVALNRPYNRRAEVFSFASVLYEMAAHTRPFWHMDAQMYVQEACLGDVRPKLPKNWPPKLCELLHDCWKGDPDARPDFDTVRQRLQDIYSNL